MSSDEKSLQKAWIEGVSSLARARQCTEQIVAQCLRSPNVGTLFTQDEMLTRGLASAFSDYLGLYKQAGDLLGSSRAAHKLLQRDDHSFAKVVFAIAVLRAEYRARRFDEARRIAVDCLAASEAQKDVLGRGLAAFELARVQARAGDRDNARQLAHQSIRAFAEALSPSKSEYRRGLSRFLLAWIAYADGRFEEAATEIAEASGLLPDGDWIHQGRILEIRGRIARAGAREDAEKLFLKARELFLKSDHRAYLASVQIDLGHLYTRSERLEEALATFQDARRRDEEGIYKAKRHYLEARLFLHSHNSQTTIQMWSGSASPLEHAKQLASIAIRGADETRTPALADQIRILLARILLARRKPGDLAEAKRQAFEIIRKSEDQGRALGTKTAIAFNLLMAELESQSPAPDKDIATAYLDLARSQLPQSSTEFLTTWTGRVDATIQKLDDASRIDWDACYSPEEFDIHRHQERVAFFGLRRLSMQHQNNRGRADLVEIARWLNIGRTGIEQWIVKWRGDPRERLGITLDALDEILERFKLPRPKRAFAENESTKESEDSVSRSESN